MQKNNSLKLVLANWKMNPRTLGEAKKIFDIYKKNYLVLNNTMAVDLRNNDEECFNYVIE